MMTPLAYMFDAYLYVCVCDAKSQQSRGSTTSTQPAEVAVVVVQGGWSSRKLRFRETPKRGREEGEAKKGT